MEKFIFIFSCKERIQNVIGSLPSFIFKSSFNFALKGFRSKLLSRILTRPMADGYKKSNLNKILIQHFLITNLSSSSPDY